MEEGNRTIILSEVLDGNAADLLKQQLLENRKHSVILDASGVKQIGGLCMQVLLSAHKSWKKDGLAFVTSDPSQDFRKSVELLGSWALVP